MNVIEYIRDKNEPQLIIPQTKGSDLIFHLNNLKHEFNEETGIMSIYWKQAVRVRENYIYDLDEITYVITNRYHEKEHGWFLLPHGKYSIHKEGKQTRYDFKIEKITCPVSKEVYDYGS